MSAADGAVWRDAPADDGGGLPAPTKRGARKFIDMHGVRSGKLLVVGRAVTSTANGAVWSCLCDCGVTVSVAGSKLRGPRARRQCGSCWRESTRTGTSQRKPRARRPQSSRAVTVALSRLSNRDRAAIAAEFPPDEFADVVRPVTRGDCLPGGSNAARPCVFAACKHHLALDVNERNGNIKLNFPDVEVWDMPETCTLDVADHDATLDGIGAVMNLTRERIRMLELSGLAKLKAKRVHLAVLIDDSVTGPHPYVRPMGGRARWASDGSAGERALAVLGQPGRCR